MDQVQSTNSFGSINYHGFLFDALSGRSNVRRSHVNVTSMGQVPAELVYLSDILQEQTSSAMTIHISEILSYPVHPPTCPFYLSGILSSPVLAADRPPVEQLVYHTFCPNRWIHASCTTNKSAVEEDKEVIEQLQKTKVNISIWGLLMASTIHREVLLAKFECFTSGTIAQVIRVNLLKFSDEDLPPEGKEHNRALQITVGCEGFYVPLVLINNGFAVNICTLATAKKIGIREEDICFRSDTTRIVRGFDNEKICVMGDFTTMVVIGPAHTKTTFLVIDINASFTMLFGRPWLYANQAVSSTLLQQLRFILGDNLIAIQGYFEEEQGKEKNNDITIPAIKKNLVENNYKEKSVNRVFYKSLSREKIPSWFENGHPKVAHYLRKYRFFPDMGLGLRGNGRTEPLNGHKMSHEAPYELGYHPTKEDRMTRELRKISGTLQTKKEAGIDWTKQPPLNGHFRQKGDCQPYMGFKEPMILKHFNGVEELVDGLENLFVKDKEKLVSPIEVGSGKSLTHFVELIRPIKGLESPEFVIKSFFISSFQNISKNPKKNQKDFVCRKNVLENNVLGISKGFGNTDKPWELWNHQKEKPEPTKVKFVSQSKEDQPLRAPQKEKINTTKIWVTCKNMPKVKTDAVNLIEDEPLQLRPQWMWKPYDKKGEIHNTRR
ncbi:hypothetical protein MKX01_018427 [Papaver californicum]|nr:hypothetical protein MKX01_018427 [Papaver californicum]